LATIPKKRLRRSHSSDKLYYNDDCLPKNLQRRALFRGEEALIGEDILNYKIEVK
jgi:hypothetical protein